MEPESSLTPDASAVGCPFAMSAPGAVGGYRCVSDGSPIAVSSRYASAYCVTDQHTACGRFLVVPRDRKGVALTPVSSPVPPPGVSHSHSANAAGVVEGLRHRTPQKVERPRRELSAGLRERLSEIEWPSLQDLPGKRVMLLLLLVLAGWLALPRLRAAGEPATALVPPVARQRVSEVSSDVSSFVRRTTTQAREAVKEAVQPVSASAKKPVPATQPKPVAKTKPIAKPKAPARPRSAGAAQPGKAVKKAPAKAASSLKSKAPARQKARPILDEKQVIYGDTMRSIAERYYGSEMMWPLVWDYNKKRAKEHGQNMVDPDLIYPGWEFLIPEEDSER